MPLTKYEPQHMWEYFKDHLNQLQGDDFFPSIFGDSNIVTSNWRPSVDIKEEDDCYVFIADIPGVDPKDIEVNAENNSLTIKGEKKEESKEEKNGYKHVERSTGTFYRRFSLPSSADTDKIEAKSKNGVLEIRIPKTEKVKAHKIPVKS